jgi:hypothetical protein
MTIVQINPLTFRKEVMASSWAARAANIVGKSFLMVVVPKDHLWPGGQVPLISTTADVTVWTLKVLQKRQRVANPEFFQ